MGIVVIVCNLFVIILHKSTQQFFYPSGLHFSMKILAKSTFRLRPSLPLHYWLLVKPVNYTFNLSTLLRVVKRLNINRSSIYDKHDLQIKCWAKFTSTIKFQNLQSTNSSVFKGIVLCDFPKQMFIWVILW